MVSTPDNMDSGIGTKEIGLDRDVFFRTMLRELSGTIVAVVGAEEAAGYVAVVGGTMGDWINRLYHEELGPADFDMETLAEIFIDLKRRLDGGFYVRSIGEDRIVLGNTRCPFGKSVTDRPALCMMTSNVFGRIGADNFGYARVGLERTIARGDPECEITIEFKPRRGVSPDEKEYYRLPPLKEQA